MKLKLPKIKFHWQQPNLGQIIKVSSWLVMIILLIAIYLSGRFLFFYFYNTLTQAEKIFLLRSEISLKQIDLNLYENVLTALKIKKTTNQEKIKQLPDLFAIGTKSTSIEEAGGTPQPHPNSN